MVAVEGGNKVMDMRHILRVIFWNLFALKMRKTERIYMILSTKRLKFWTRIVNIFEII